MYRSIAIIGAGTAGWFTAAFLKTQFPDKEITLIDSTKTIPPIGVGESTTPSFTKFLLSLGVDPKSWITATNGSYKLGIIHNNWSGGYLQKKDFFCGYTHNCYTDNCRCEMHNTKKTVPDDVNLFAFNIDATQIAARCKQLFIEKGGKIVHECVSGIAKTQDSHVSHIHINNAMLVADYYIDCSGFNNIFNFKRDNLMLLNNTALVYRDNAVSDTDLYTKTYALDYGWQWKIPLKHNTGYGIVYNNNFVTDEKIADYYKNNITNFDETRLRKISFTPSICNEPFQSNYSCIGLSSGFIEPLEATAIDHIIFLIKRTVDKLNGRSSSALNRYWQIYFNNTLDFVLGRYTLSQKQNDYWRYYRESFPGHNANLVEKAKSNSIFLGQFNSSMYENLIYGYLGKC